MPDISPLAPKTFPDLPPVPGVRLQAMACGIKYKQRKDVMLALMEAGTQVAGVFTTSKTAGAPVVWCQKILSHGIGRALVVNSGNSNAFTGAGGMAALERIVAKAAAVCGVAREEVYIASTGVIAEPLPDHKIIEKLETLHGSLDSGSWQAAAEAILTTDTFPKSATRTATLGDTTVTLNGIAKGSGMIAPDMATMLAFCFTDAAIPARVLQQLLTEANAKSFNAITVDSDTSTSDTALLFATGKATHPPVTAIDDPHLQDFRKQLHSLLTELAHLIVRDGEGATKFVTVTVTGAEHDMAAHTIAMAIANSPLVKTAIAGEDANWGRIVMAVGKAGERADRDKLRIEIGGYVLAEYGERVDGFDEAPVARHMKSEEIDIRVDVGIASGTATVWTCDLTHGYISINADYRS